MDVTLKELKELSTKLNTLLELSEQDAIDVDSFDDENELNELIDEIEEVVQLFEKDDEITHEMSEVISRLEFETPMPKGVIILPPVEAVKKAPAKNVISMKAAKEAKASVGKEKKTATKKTVTKAPAKIAVKKPVEKKTVEKKVVEKAVSTKKAPAKPVSTKKAEAKKTVEKVAGKKPVALDKFGFKKGTQRSDIAIDMGTGKFTMVEIKEKYGSSHYNILSNIKNKGFNVSYNNTKKIKIVSAV